MNEENERICVELNEKDVQEMVDCYEKDIKYIKQLEYRIDKATEYINNYMPNYDFDHYDLEKLLNILKGEDNV
jgi:hypothetical protein